MQEGRKEMAGPAGAGGGSAQKRGRPPNNPNSGGGGGGGGGGAPAAAGASAAGEAMAVGGVAQASVVPSLGPTLQVHSNFAGTKQRIFQCCLRRGWGIASFWFSFWGYQVLLTLSAAAALLGFSCLSSHLAKLRMG